MHTEHLRSCGRGTLTASDPFGRRLYELARDQGSGSALRFKDRLLTFADVSEALDAVAARIGPVVGLRATGTARWNRELPGPPAPLPRRRHVGGAIARVHPRTAQRGAARIRPDLLIISPALFRKYADVDLGCPVLLVREGSHPADWQSRGDSGTTVSGTESDTRVVLFTSGSTGEPKGVCLGSDSLTAAARMNAMTLGLEPGRRSVSTVPFHDYYGLIQVYSHLLAGAELVIGESVAFTAELLRQIERARVTDLVGVPYGLRRIFRAAADAGNSGSRDSRWSQARAKPSRWMFWG